MVTRPLEEATVVAMYMNNRAVESLARGKTDDAYWYAREAIVRAPSFLIAYNTLGAVYRKHGDLADDHADFAQPRVKVSCPALTDGPARKRGPAVP